MQGREAEAETLREKGLSLSPQPPSSKASIVGAKHSQLTWEPQPMGDSTPFQSEKVGSGGIGLKAKKTDCGQPRSKKSEFAALVLYLWQHQ